MDTVGCKERCGNMVSWTDASETCKMCKDAIRQKRERMKGMCTQCQYRRPWVGKVCFGCSYSKAYREQAKPKKKRGWLW